MWLTSIDLAASSHLFRADFQGLAPNTGDGKHVLGTAGHVYVANFTFTGKLGLHPDGKHTAVLLTLLLCDSGARISICTTTMW